MISSSLISSIHKSRQILVDLLTRQGYNTEDYANFSINEVNTMTQNKQLDMLVEKPTTADAPTLKMYIRYYLGNTLKQQTVQEIIDDLFNLEQILTKKDILYIIVKDDMNETLTNSIQNKWLKYPTLTFVFNIMVIIRQIYC